MSGSGSHSPRPASDRTTVPLDPTRVFPGPGTAPEADGHGDDPTTSTGKVIVGEILRRRHRAPRVHRRRPRVVGAAVLSATGVLAGLSMLVHPSSSSGPSQAGRQPTTSTLGRPPEAAPGSLPSGAARPGTSGATRNLPTRTATSTPTATPTAVPTAPASPTGGAGSAAGGLQQAASAALDGFSVPVAPHGHGLHLGSGDPLAFLPPGLARG